MPALASFSLGLRAVTSSRPLPSRPSSSPIKIRPGKDVGEAEYGMQHGRFAGAVGADEAQRLRFPHAQVDAVQDFHPTIAGAQVFQRDMGLAARQRVELVNLNVFGDGGRPASNLLHRNDAINAAVAKCSFFFAHLPFSRRSLSARPGRRQLPAGRFGFHRGCRRRAFHRGPGSKSYRPCS